MLTDVPDDNGKFAQIKCSQPKVGPLLCYNATQKPSVVSRKVAVQVVRQQFVVVIITIADDSNKTGCLDWMSSSAGYMPFRPIGATARRAYRRFAFV